ncbi:MAG: amine dehydrogenase large subunit, partial [Pseudomonadota bacterium]
MIRLTLAIAGLAAAGANADIAPEPLGVVESLPESYPPHWIIVQDGSFFHMSDGKFIVLDVSSDDAAARYKGMFNGSFIPQLTVATKRPEFYVAETFHSRGNRGERTDVLTFYDKRSLAPQAEVIIPPKRASSIPTHYHVQLTDDEEFVLIYNFSPAQSVSVVNAETRSFAGEVPVPGCALAFPMQGRAFASLCGDGKMLRVRLDDSGAVESAERTEAFFDAENDPLMEKPAIIDGVGYFPTFLGSIVPVDLSGDMPRPQSPWSLVDGEDGDWRPGGIAVAGSDANGRLYVLMHPGGYDGSHKDPGTEVWVFDVDRQQRVGRIELATPAITIGLTAADEPLLVATNINLTLDVYAVAGGEHLRTIADFGQETPFLFH